MNEIRKITDHEIGPFLRLMGNSYPSLGLFNEQARHVYEQRMVYQFNEDDCSSFYGYFRENELLGGMKFYDFQMNVYGTKVYSGGIGHVCVDLLHKKERIAKEMLTYYLRHYRSAGASIAMLHPFRVSFYKQMGFGLGPKMHQYRVFPASLPKGPKDHIVYLTHQDKQDIVDCYNRYADLTHGMMEKNDFECRRWFDDASNLYVGYKQGEQILGYLVFSFKKASDTNFLLNDLLIREMIYETPDALSQLLAFLRSQEDQVNRIIYNTQDEDFHFLLSDTGNGVEELMPHVSHQCNVSAIGLMYRVINVPGLFTQLAAHNFGSQTCKMKLTIKDSFLPENEGSTYIHFTEGHPAIADSSDYEVEVTMDVSDFSSLIMGVASFRSLHTFKLIDLSDDTYLNTVAAIFRVDVKPRCTTPF